MAIPNSMHGREFIEAYRSHVCLWNSSDYRYKNKKLRNRAYDDLFTIYKQIEPEATIDGMKKKINNIRRKSGKAKNIELVVMKFMRLHCGIFTI